MKKMKRSPSFSSSSSSSCIESVGSSPIVINKPKSKSKRNTTSRAKKIVDLQNQNQINPETPTSGNGRRSSSYRGVTRHRWTGRFEAHLWDKTTWNTIQNKKGRQIYLGAYDNEEAAARTYDLAAIKYWGPTTILNFPVETYAKEIEDMEKMSKDEFMASLRRKSSGFSRGVSKYRGVARHHHNGRWEARIGRVFGSKYLYLGTFSTQEEAAAAYDKAAIEYRGPSAITNFDISTYADQLKEYQQRMEQNTPITRSSSSSDITQAITQTEHVQQQQQNTETIDAQQVMDYEIPYEESQPMMEMMDPYDEQDNPWNMCALDNTGFNNSCLPIDIPFDEPAVELPDLFVDSGFDDIDYLFDFPVIENQDYVSSGSGSTLCGGVQVDSSPGKDQQAAESSSSTLSSASVCTEAWSSFKC